VDGSIGKKMYEESIRTAIVLRVQAKKLRVTVLDGTEGKNVFLCSDYVSAGSYIAYRVYPTGGIMRLVVHELFAVPLTLASYALPFLHHVLEICDFGIPVGLHIQEVYDFLVWLCTEITIPMRPLEQDLFLAKILMTLGLHATRLSLCSLCMLRIHGVSIDTFNTLALDLKCKEQLQSWILSCLEEHISVTMLKTFMSLKDYRTI
jgi:hypothetical protein